MKQEKRETAGPQLIREWDLPLLLISFCCGLLTVVGQNYNTSVTMASLWETPHAILKNGGKLLLITAAVYFIVHIFSVLFCHIPTRRKQGSRSFWVWWGIFLIGWLPFLIVNYPGHLMGDTCSQIPMAFHLPNKFSNNVILLSEDVILTNHHPVVHTMLLGLCVRLGRMLFSSDGAGLFLYTMFQYCVITGIYGYALAWLDKIKISETLLLCLTGFWYFVPYFSEYAILATKDGLFSAFLLLYAVYAGQLMKREFPRFSDWGKLAAACILCMLFRNNGFYIILLSVPFLAAVGKQYRKSVVSLLFLILLLHAGYNSLLLPALRITPGSVREFFSVPLQQTARYMITYPEEVTREEKESFDGVVNMEKALDAYDPMQADAVKSKWRKSAARDEILRFVRCWIGIVKKHPLTCVEATLCSLNGYYSFQRTGVWNYGIYSAEKQAERIERESGFQMGHPELFRRIRHLFGLIPRYLTKIPVFSLLMQAAFYNWILLILLINAVRRRRWRLLALLVPAAAALLTALAGPMNALTYFRYEYPIAVILPLIGCAAMDRSYI